ncbi:oryzain alpha chain-like [Triticum dicoccoides]|nr:oryzain alpha chain-like [Triticum dicoccoides]
MRSPPTAVMTVAALLLLLLVSLTAAAEDTTAKERERIQELHDRVLADWKAGHGKNIRSEEESRRAFAQWKAEYRKKYSSAREEEHRYAFFKESLRKVDLHNAAFGPNSVYSIKNGLFSDRTDEEWRFLSQGMSPYIPREEPNPQMLPIYICGVR